MGRVAKRYARAFFQLTEKNLPAARTNLASLGPVKELFENQEAAKVLASPAMPMDLKQSLLKYALDQGNASVETRNFVNTVAEGSRVEAIPDAVDAYAELIDEAEGTLKAQVSSAAPLDSATQQGIASALEGILKKKVVLESSIDSSLLGGFVVRVGNYLVDLSLKTRLDALSESAVQEA